MDNLEPLAEHRRMRTLSVMTLFAFLSGASAAADAPVRDHDAARQAVESGQQRPLSAILKQIEATHPGRVLEIERDREDGRTVYEIELLDARGRVIELTVDAASGEVLRTDVDD